MNNKISDVIHVALSPWDLSDDYNRHAGATLLSLMENCSVPVIAHLMYNARLGDKKDIEYTKSCYDKIAKMYGGRILYHHIDLPQWVLDIPNVKKWTPGTLMRLYLPELLPDIDKIVYIDCDMIITTDVARLYTTDLQDYFLGACYDISQLYFSRSRLNYYRKKKIPTDRYFCAGTLLLNLRLLHETRFTDKVWLYFMENQDLPFLDQDLLNWFCQGNYMEINEKYNIYYNRVDAIDFADDCIIHYAAKYKPWKRYGGKIDDYYWKYLLKTPWCENKMQTLEYMRQSPDIKYCISILPKYCFSYLITGDLKKVTQVMKLILRLEFAIIMRGIAALKFICIKLKLI